MAAIWTSSTSSAFAGRVGLATPTPGRYLKIRVCRDAYGDAFLDAST